MKEVLVNISLMQGSTAASLERTPTRQCGVIHLHLQCLKRETLGKRWLLKTPSLERKFSELVPPFNVSLSNIADAFSCKVSKVYSAKHMLVPHKEIRKACRFVGRLKDVSSCKKSCANLWSPPLCARTHTYDSLRGQRCHLVTHN